MARYSLYQSKYDLDKGGSASGYLLKFISEERLCFYSNLQSWSSLDGENSDELIQNFSQSGFEKSNLLKNSFQLALDSNLKLKDGDLGFIASHYLAKSSRNLDDTDIVNIIEGGFKSIKVKIHHDLKMSLIDLFFWLEALPPNISLRLDFNLKFSKEEVFSALDKFDKNELSRVDWIEDPFVGSFEEWTDLSSQFGIRTAMDWHQIEQPDLNLYEDNILRIFAELEKLEKSEAAEENISKFCSELLSILRDLRQIPLDVAKPAYSFSSFQPIYSKLSRIHSMKKNILNMLTKLNIQKAGRVADHELFCEPKHCDLLVTSYLSHPLEQIQSSLFAKELISKGLDVAGGLCSHYSYPRNKYSNLLKLKNGSLEKIDCLKLNELLEKESWVYVSDFEV